MRSREASSISLAWLTGSKPHSLSVSEMEQAAFRTGTCSGQADELGVGWSSHAADSCELWKGTSRRARSSDFNQGQAQLV